MTRKSIVTSAQETIVAAGKSAAKRAKALAGEVANAASEATATAVPRSGIRQRVRKKLLWPREKPPPKGPKL